MVQQCEASGAQVTYKLSWLEEAYLPQRIKSSNVIGNVLRNGHGFCDRLWSPNEDAYGHILNPTKFDNNYHA
jgi:hypothetical protein